MQHTAKSRHWLAFGLALLASGVIFAPFLVMDRGYFIYYGDFNVQQIPFYQLAHEAVRTGNIGWSWFTDLGANFVGSYSFYLLFSPFFWLTLPFPTWMVPYLMAPLLMLKTACAALSACLYLNRFVKDKRYAVIGGLLYAFSGWMLFNIFFNHFHEAAVFFPLLLLGVELLVEEDRRGVFALAVAVNAMVNYWFFVGEVVFVILYVLVRRTDKSWPLNIKRFLILALESVLGVGIAAFALLPSVSALLGNPRTGADELLTGWNVWLYWHEQRQPAILQSLFFPPELPARPNFFPDHGAKWASLSAWLPLLSMTGVIAYFYQRKNDWLKKLLALCLVFALVPALNSLFIMLNNSYYARWFYMAILLMAMATVRALESAPDDVRPFLSGVKWSALACVVFIAMCGLTPNIVEEELRFGLAQDLRMLWTYSALTMLCLAITSLITIQMRRNRHITAMTLAAILVVSTGFGIYYIANGKNNAERSQWMIQRAIEGEVTLPSDTFARSDVYDSTDNIAMFWGLPNIQAFHSIVPPSIMEFYPQVGVKRDVGSRPEAEFYALRPLLSVRWLFIEEGKEEQAPMPGYRYYDTQNGFNIYENQHFLPLGFTYDTYVTERQMEDVATEKRSHLMLRAAVLDEETAARHADLLAPLDDDGYYDFNEVTLADDVEALRQYTASRVDIDRKGFTVTTDFDRERLLFVSVPWEQGWSASLTGAAGVSPVAIERVNIGFMGIRVPAGPVTIRFDYETPGLRLGIWISAAALAAWLLYFLVCWRLRRRKPALPPPVDPERLLKGEPVHLTLEQYRAQYGDKEARAERLQRTLNEAGAAYLQETLNPDDKTLRFHPPAEQKEAPGQHIPRESGNTPNNKDNKSAGGSEHG